MSEESGAVQGDAAEEIVVPEVAVDPGLVKLRTDLADCLISAEESGGKLKLEVTPEGLLAVCEALKLRPEFAFDYPADLTAWDTGESFVVWYRLWSMQNKRTAIVRVTVSREDAEVPSVTYIWPGFNWFEREAYDLYGIRFLGHPEQDDPARMRILMPEDWVGFPFRKDFEPVFEDDPLHGPQRPN
jgi:NADH:ubiquinone oxidoreductase subunit C